jgi:hypothetical protein
MVNAEIENQRPLPTDTELHRIATDTTTPLDIQLRNYTKQWVELFLVESEICIHVLHDIGHAGYEPHNIIHNILEDIYVVEFHEERPYFELQLDGLYDTIMYGSNNPLPHRCPNQIDRLMNYIKATYRQITTEPLGDFTFEDNDEIIIQFICSVIWSDGREWIINWARAELQSRMIERTERMNEPQPEDDE